MTIKIFITTRVSLANQRNRELSLSSLHNFSPRKFLLLAHSRVSGGGLLNPYTAETERVRLPVLLN